MADSPLPPDFAPRAGRPVTAATRQRLQAIYDRAKACLERGDHDYAHDLLTQCMADDPGNLLYAQTFRANLSAKHAGEGKKSSMFGALVGNTSRGVVAKAAARGAWVEAFTLACQALKKNPLDIPVLRELASGCGTLGHTELQLYYLRWALDLDTQNIDTNVDAAQALAGDKQFDQAIACWQRVLKQKPDNEAARKAVASLSVEQTLHQGGYNPELLKSQSADETPTVRVSDFAVKDADGQQAQTETAEPHSVEQLTLILQKTPGDLPVALDLARQLVGSKQPDQALKIIRQAVSHCDAADDDNLTLLEDLQLQIAHDRANAAQQLAQTKRTAGTLKQARLQLAESNQLETQVYAARAARQPGDTRSLFELGLRQKRAGEHREAIKSLQAARSDLRRQAEIQLNLGECFQHIEQFKLASSSYEAALNAAQDASEEVRKLALYRAGVLAMGLGDLDRAENRLTELAGLDFGYKDVADRLDKVAAMRKNT